MKIKNLPKEFRSELGELLKKYDTELQVYDYSADSHGGSQDIHVIVNIDNKYDKDGHLIAQGGVVDL